MSQAAKPGTISVAVKVSQSGRLHLPSDVRKALGLKGPGHVVITVADGQATLTTMAQNLARIRALARPYAPKGRLASDELIAERREEARREAAPSQAAGAGGERRARRRGGGG
jgi:bifunctional DNA-binding transcriptional regulator/antitoxin component of YhaV-PrlF toxin-antitoxin module